MGRGQLIAESLRRGELVRGIPMRLLGVTRVVPPVERLHQSQPRVWTFVGFEIDDADASRLAEVLAGALEDEPLPWYCSFATADETWIVYRQRIFHYQRGDGAGRADAQAYGRAAGVPEPQLDWGE